MFPCEGLALLVDNFKRNCVDTPLFNFVVGLGGDVELQIGEDGVLLVHIVDYLSGLFDGVDDEVDFIFESFILLDLYFQKLVFQHFFCSFGVLSDFALQLGQIEVGFYKFHNLRADTLKMAQFHSQPLILNLV